MGVAQALGRAGSLHMPGVALVNAEKQGSER